MLVLKAIFFFLFFCKVKEMEDTRVRHNKEKEKDNIEPNKMTKKISLHLNHMGTPII